jgi:hypothetical protein
MGFILPRETSPQGFGYGHVVHPFKKRCRAKALLGTLTITTQPDILLPKLIDNMPLTEGQYYLHRGNTIGPYCGSG